MLSPRRYYIHNTYTYGVFKVHTRISFRDTTHVVQPHKHTHMVKNAIYRQKRNETGQYKELLLVGGEEGAPVNT